MVSLDACYLAGALRDGSIYVYKYKGKNKNYFVIFYQKHKEWLEKSIAPRLRNLFGKTGTIDEYKQGQYRLRLSSKKAYEYFHKEMGFPIYNRSQERWNVPELILKSNSDCKKLFIKAVFDTEGDVSPLSSNIKYVGISQKNKSFLYDIARMLEEFKIKANPPHVIDRKTNTYRISITGSNLKLFIEKIGSEHPIKKNALDRLYQQLT